MPAASFRCVYVGDRGHDAIRGEVRHARQHVTLAKPSLQTSAYPGEDAVLIGARHGQIELPLMIALLLRRAQIELHCGDLRLCRAARTR